LVFGFGEALAEAAGDLVGDIVGEFSGPVPFSPVFDSTGDIGAGVEGTEV